MFEKHFVSVSKLLSCLYLLTTVLHIGWKFLQSVCKPCYSWSKINLCCCAKTYSCTYELFRQQVRWVLTGIGVLYAKIKKKEELHSSIEGWETLASILPMFFSYDAVGFRFSRLQCNPNSDDLFNLFNKKNACYHQHSCQIKYSNSKLNRLICKFEKLAKVGLSSPMPSICTKWNNL